MNKRVNSVVIILLPAAAVLVVIASLAGKPPPRVAVAPAPPVVITPTRPEVKPLPPPRAEPGDKVKWVRHEATQEFSDDRCGPVLTDIERHISPVHNGYYRDADPLTWGHETTHGINSDLRAKLARPGQNAFYCLEGKAIVLSNPKLTIRDVAAVVPPGLRGGRYNTYLASQTGWNDTPTYILDEWVAYTNGTAVGADQWKNGKVGRAGRSDDAVSPMEFTYYTLALCVAIKKHDPGYFKNNPEFSEFVAFNIRRSVGLFRELIREENFAWDAGLVDTFTRNGEAAELKAVADELWGKDFVDKYLRVK